ncbi:CLUMA_CG006583, isoform A [Clunio marinus]|uniref:Serine/threonine-protein kinase 11-interacting protein n=1 Tax=Clunio marinus TaxID=568069 RepID=A0A1J1I2K8_9DIPT|nr:CLUMA_CG006583, isoform A [Clunio marinus]
MKIIFYWKLLLITITIKWKTCLGTKANIILILTDDQDLLLKSLENLPKVDNLLTKEGAIFSNAFTSSPICCPSRASILSGLYAHNTQTYNNSHDGGCYSNHWIKNIEPFTFPVKLKEAGYETFFAGKYLNQYKSKEVPIGYDQFFGLHGNSVYYNYTLNENGKLINYKDTSEDYLTNVIKSRSLNFIKNQTGVKPFFAMLSVPSAHAPFTPEAKYKDYFKNKTAPNTKNFNIGAKPFDKHWLMTMKPHEMDDSVLATIDEYYRRRLETLLTVDDLVEDIVNQLTDQMMIDNTYIILTSDNGYHLGQWAMPFDKRLPYETDIRVPLIVRGPHISQSIINSPVLLIDIAPTILNWAKVPLIIEDFDGKPFDYLLTHSYDGKIEERQMLIEYWGEGNQETFNPSCPYKKSQRLSGCTIEAGCKCEDSWNNTYACARHIAQDINFIFCMFDDHESFQEAYDLNEDIYQLQNIGYDILPSVQAKYQITIQNLKECRDIIMDPKSIEKLAKVLRDQGDKLLTSEFKFTLTGDLLRSLNDSFSLIIDESELVPPMTFQVTKPNNSKSNVFRDLIQIYDFIQKTLILKLTKFLDEEDLLEDNCIIDISKFRSLLTLEIQRVPIERITGLQGLRSQLQEIVAEKCLTNIKDLIMFCAGDKSSGFIWNSLKRADFSYNNLEKIDSSFEFTPYLQHLNLSHNKIFQISALVWLPNLKFLNLSFNNLTSIPKLNVESYRRLQSLIITDNIIEDISGLARLDALLELDLSGNFMLDHSLLLPLCTLSALRYLNLTGNPLSCHPKHRSATCRFLSKNAATVQFLLDGSSLSKYEKSLTGSYENYYPIFGHRISVSASSTVTSRAIPPQTPSTKSINNTPEGSSLSSVNSLLLNNSSNATISQENQTFSNQKRMKPRCVVIEESDAKHDKQLEEKSPKDKKMLKEASQEHLVTKREIEQLREQYGSEWLFNQGAVVGFEDQNVTARKKLLLGDLLSTSPALRMDESFEKSDPTDSSTPLEETIIPFEEATGNKSIDDSEGNSIYTSALDETFPQELPEEEEEKIVLSEPEDNEIKFIVIDEFSQDDLFLIITETNIKEKDAMSTRTNAKWGMSTLESVERPRSDLIRLTFDTIRKDKRERQYRMDLKCCQELEKILRDFLSSRPLSEMNQTVYKCPKCNSQFSREIDDRKKRDYEIKCSCGNKYVIEIHKTTKCETSPPKTFLSGNFFSSTTSSTAQGTIQKTASSISIEKKGDAATGGGIPKTSHSFSSIESAFDSNQSVAGSSVEVLSECSSQMSQISQTSQSSIEVLDSIHGSRKPSEERRILQKPTLDTINDNGQKHDESPLNETLTSSTEMKNDLKSKTLMNLANVNLTESSSSGSVCESIVTTYEKGKQSEKSTTEGDKPNESKLEGIFKSSSILLSKTQRKESESEPNFLANPIHYNYEDLSVVDHRVKLYLFQNILEENDEKLMWLVKTLVIEDDAGANGKPFYSLVIMSTKKIYVLKIIGEETEDIGSWLKKVMFHSIDRIETIHEIVDKLGISFVFKSKAKIHLLLPDQHVTDRLTKHITTSSKLIKILKLRQHLLDHSLRN